MIAQVRPRLVVLESFPTPRPTTNPYITMLWRALQATPEIEVRTFQWRTAVLGSYDVFHVHWPELQTYGRTRLRAFANQLLLAVLLLRLWLTRTPVVRTLHNLRRPSGISRVQNLLLAWWERQTTWVILLNTSAVSTISAPTTTIIHGHYRDWFAVYPHARPVPGRLAYFGLVRPYKGVDRLLEAFRQLPGEAYSLSVAGNPTTADLAQHIRELARSDRRVDLQLEYLPDPELVRVATEAELVVLPYREMHNSGGALAALSLDRPVLLPANEVNSALAREVGEDWVYQFAGELSPEALAAALTSAHSRATGTRPDLSSRDWDLVGERHAEAYRDARQAKKGRHLTRND